MQTPEYEFILGIFSDGFNFFSTHRFLILGPPFERQRLQSLYTKRHLNKSHNVILIASYDLVRNDIEFFSGIRWNYAILDEGHVIKNNKTKVRLLLLLVM